MPLWPLCASRGRPCAAIWATSRWLAATSSGACDKIAPPFYRTHTMQNTYPLIESLIGNTPLVRLARLPGNTTNNILVKLEGNNPAVSVQDRPAYNILLQAELRGDISPGDTLIEATSGNTGIALAMVCAFKGYRLILIMPDNMSAERRASMSAYGADLVLVTEEEGMEGARDLATKMAAEGKG